LIGGGHWNGNENLDFVGRKYNAEAQRTQRFAEKREKRGCREDTRVGWEMD
jgi:hypothetical protein